MKTEQIAIQLYTLRDFTETPDDFVATIKRVREIGYHAVELAGTAGLPPAEAAKIVRDAGLQICSSHESPQMILENPQQVVDRLGEFGITHAVYPWPDGIDFSNTKQVDELIAGLDSAGAMLRRAGMTLCYHNHALEYFQRDGRTVLDDIFARTSPEHLQAELDIHWVQAGGGDPAEACRRLTGRLPLLHVKDYTVTAKGERLFAEVGHGNMNIPEILAAAKAAGCQWFIVEQDTCPTDPFECIALSLDYLKGLCD
ncbi:MAG: sugar phosphate isomerase/epimerase [Verrucomicrobiaceae bacterium]|nr:MAG: sugar phosphate isomerase/epimerase [Verrucomicrobiaceae bacterium]